VLKVIDNRGGSASTSVVVAVDNKPPVAALSVSPSTGVAPLSTSLSSFGSYDLDGLISSYKWDLGDGTLASTPQLSKTYAAPGLYYVTLTVTDSGNATASRTVNVLVGKSLAISSSTFSLNFTKQGVDRLTLASKTVPVPVDMPTAGLAGTLRVGTSEFFFTLSDKGRFVSPQMNLTLTPKRAQLRLTVKNVNLVNGLSKTGAVSDDVRQVLVVIPFALTFSDGTSLGSTGLPYVYTATKGKTGRGSLYKPK